MLDAGIMMNHGLVINEDINIVLDSNSEMEDCPCKEMVYDIENSITDLTEIEKTVSLGMLMMYCDVRKSLLYFKNYLIIILKVLYIKK